MWLAPTLGSSLWLPLIGYSWYIRLITLILAPPRCSAKVSLLARIIPSASFDFQDRYLSVRFRSYRTIVLLELIVKKLQFPSNLRCHSRIWRWLVVGRFADVCDIEAGPSSEPGRTPGSIRLSVESSVPEIHFSTTRLRGGSRRTLFPSPRIPCWSSSLC